MAETRPGRAHSLLEITAEALRDLVREAHQHGVDLGWTIDPMLPPYINVMRVDLFAIISVLVRRALQVVSDQPLHLTVAQGAPGQVVLQLEDGGEAAGTVSPQDWKQLRFWVEELGGQIARGNEGLHWTISLPLDSMSAAQLKLSRDAGVRVMMVCADTDARGRVLAQLQQAGDTLVECRDASEALAMARRRRFDLLLIDLDLPDGSGATLARELRVLTPKWQVFAIMMAGQPMPLAGLEWIQHWLRKPPRDEELAPVLAVARQSRGWHGEVATAG